MGRYKEWLLVQEEEKRLAGLADQTRAAAKEKRAALKKARADAQAKERAYRSERRRNARTEAELVALAYEFGYKNPEWWAKRVLEGRGKDR